MRGRMYPDFRDVGVDLDDVGDQLFILNVFELDLVEIHVLARHSFVRLEEHWVSTSHTTDAAVEVRLGLHLIPECYIPHSQLTGRRARNNNIVVIVVVIIIIIRKL